MVRSIRVAARTRVQIVPVRNLVHFCPSFFAVVRRLLGRIVAALSCMSEGIIIELATAIIGAGAVRVI